MNRETYLKIEEYMRSCMDDGAHDRDHVYRVLYVGLDIASTEPGVDYDVLIPALLLHDIGRPEQSADPSKDHAEVGARKAYAFLTGNAFQSGFPAEKARTVAECIYTHRFRNSHRPATIEAKILFDADKVDVSGTIGIARTLQYSGTFGEPLYTLRPDGMPDTFASSASSEVTPAATASAVPATHPEAPDSFLREYKFKLEKIYDNFYTRRAAEIAASRRAAASAFHTALLSEITSTFTLGLSALSKILLPQ